MAIASLALLALPAPSPAQSDLSQQVPPPPTGLKATFKSNHVVLTWSNFNAPSVSEIRVFRLENYSPDTTLKTIAAVPRNTAVPQVTYNDTTVLPGRTYTYFLTSKSRFGMQSDNSQMSTVATPPTFSNR
jgi:hypothetical protein